MDVCMHFPQTTADWEVIAGDFEEKWNFPHCLGAIDGKHVVRRAPGNTGSLYFNYKGTFSVVLMALVDANLKFIAIDVGSYGRNSDGGIFSNSNLGKSILTSTINFPEDSPLPKAPHLGPMPYVVVGDEAFPLRANIMRPYPEKGCARDQHIFNYRLSRARRIVENAFGILAARWRVLHTKIGVRPALVNDIVKASCVLHNYLQGVLTPAQTAILIREGTPSVAMEDVMHGAGCRAAGKALEVREKFRDYFVNYDPLVWQVAHVNRGSFN